MTRLQIITKNALFITLMIGGFFLISKLLGVHENPYLRFLNILFVILGIRNAVYSNITKNNDTNYINNLGIGLQTSAVAVVLSIIGVIGYIAFINPNFLLTMDNSFLISGDLSLAELFITLLIEGMASTFVGSFMVMMFYKNHDKVLATQKA